MKIGERDALVAKVAGVRAILRKCRTLDEFEEAREEIAMMVMKLASGAAITFRDKAALIEEL